MNKPIQTEGRSKRDRQRMRQNGGPQSELNEALADAATPGIGQEQAPAVENTEGTVADAVGLIATAPFPGSDREWTAEEKAGINNVLKHYGWKESGEPAIMPTGVAVVTRDGIAGEELVFHAPGQDPTDPPVVSMPLLSQRTNLDMGDGTILHTGTLEEARQRPTISAEALMRGEEVVTREAILSGVKSFIDTLAPPAHVPFIAPIGEPLASTAPHLDTPSKIFIDESVYVPPQSTEQRFFTDPDGRQRPGYVTENGMIVDQSLTFLKNTAPAKPDGDFIDFTKLPLPRLKVLVRKLPTSVAVSQAHLQNLMAELYLTVHGLERGWQMTKGGTKYSFVPNQSILGYTFIDTPKRERSKLFEAWARKIDSHGVNAGTSFSAYMCSFDGEPTKNPDDIVDVWAVDIYPNELQIDPVSQDNTSTVTHGRTVFGVGFGGIVTRLHDISDDVKTALVAA